MIWVFKVQTLATDGSLCKKGDPIDDQNIPDNFVNYFPDWKQYGMIVPQEENLNTSIKEEVDAKFEADKKLAETAIPKPDEDSEEKQDETNTDNPETPNPSSEEKTEENEENKEENKTEEFEKIPEVKDPTEDFLSTKNKAMANKRK